MLIQSRLAGNHCKYKAYLMSDDLHRPLSRVDCIGDPEEHCSSGCALEMREQNGTEPTLGDTGRHVGTYAKSSGSKSPAFDFSGRSLWLRCPRAYNVLRVLSQGETRADFLEKSIRKTGRHLRGAQ